MSRRLAWIFRHVRFYQESGEKRHPCLLSPHPLLPSFRDEGSVQTVVLHDGRLLIRCDEYFTGLNNFEPAIAKRTYRLAFPRPKLTQSLSFCIGVEFVLWPMSFIKAGRHCCAYYWNVIEPRCNGKSPVSGFRASAAESFERNRYGNVGGAADIHPDGTILFTSFSDGTARTWQAETCMAVQSFAGHTDYVNRVRFSSDGQTVFTSSAGDTTMRLWETQTGRELRRFGHLGGGADFVLSPDSKRLVTYWSYPNNARTCASLWD